MDWIRSLKFFLLSFLNWCTVNSLLDECNGASSEVQSSEMPGTRVLTELSVLVLGVEECVIVWCCQKVNLCDI
jgi:hypothetical protein